MGLIKGLQVWGYKATSRTEEFGMAIVRCKRIVSLAHFRVASSIKGVGRAHTFGSPGLAFSRYSSSSSICEDMASQQPRLTMPHERCSQVMMPRSRCHKRVQ